jgi:hypothetical protein
MATPAEVRAKLEALSPDEFKKFQRAFGGEGYIPERYAREMAQKPEWEYRICQLLDLPTEQERTNHANSEALEAAKASARAAEKSALKLIRQTQSLRARTSWQKMPIRSRLSRPRQRRKRQTLHGKRTGSRSSRWSFLQQSQSALSSSR